MPYSEEQIEEFYDPYQSFDRSNRYGFTDGYVETDPETCVPVAVFYNENNLANVGLVVNRIANIGNYDAAREQLTSGHVFCESAYGDVYVSEDHGSDSGIDYGWMVCCSAEVVEPYEEGMSAWRDNLPLIRVETSVPDKDNTDEGFNRYHRACWNAMRRALTNFAE